MKTREEELATLISIRNHALLISANPSIVKGEYRKAFNRFISSVDQQVVDYVIAYGIVLDAEESVIDGDKGGFIKYGEKVTKEYHPDWLNSKAVLPESTKSNKDTPTEIKQLNFNFDPQQKESSKDKSIDTSEATDTREATRKEIADRLAEAKKNLKKTSKKPIKKAGDND